MCGAKVGCVVVCEGNDAFFIKKCTSTYLNPEGGNCY